MVCANCGHENSDRARFCENCGKPLPRTCPDCREKVSPTARFCSNCGFNLQAAPQPSLVTTPPQLAASGDSEPAALERLRDAAPAELQERIRSVRKDLEGERKLVSALFADIVGSTEFAERLDPEDWRDVVSGVHQRIGAAVHRYGGYIAQLLGDGVLAFFGAPLAHEDDAERAVRASLDIIGTIEEYAREPRTRRLAPNIQIRVGINSGNVVVGNVGSDLRMEYLAIGDTVNLAARLQSAATANHILISESTRRLIQDRFELEDQGRITVKGKAEPVQIYSVLGVRRGADVARQPTGLASPLVGRDRELSTLRRLTDDLAAGHGGIVTIVAEAGIGKTRLAAEWRQSARPGQQVKWAIGRCLSFETVSPYQLVVKLLRSLLDLPPDLNETQLSTALHERCFALMNGLAQEVYPFLAHLLGGALEEDQEALVRYLDGPALQARYSTALGLLLEHLARTTPVVLQADDVHWADTSSVELIGQLLPLAGRAPVVFAFLIRPERDAVGWRLVTMSRETPGVGVIELHLAPLGEIDSLQLVNNLLSMPGLPPSLLHLMLAKTEGNPFYLEEVLRMLIDRGWLAREDGGWALARELRELDVPDTLQGVIGARIDRLPEDAKRVLQVASVIGRRFSVQMLRDVLEGMQTHYDLPQQLAAFEASDIVRSSTQAAGREYAFKHSLVQETVYAGLLRPARAELHRRVAEIVERSAGSDEVTRATLLALHFDRAGMPLQAFRYAMEAGDRARHRHAHHEALNFYDRVVSLAQESQNPALLAQLRRVYWARGQARQGIADQAGALIEYEAMLQEARTAGSAADQAEALTWLLPMRILLHSLTPDIEQQLQEALRLAEQTGDLWLETRAQWSAGLAYRFADPLRGEAYLQRAADMAANSSDPRLIELHGYILNDLTIAQATMGRYHQASITAQAAVAVFRRLNHPTMLTDALGGASMQEYFGGNPGPAWALGVEGKTLAHQINNSWGITYNCMTLAPLAFDEGRWGEAQSLARELLAHAERLGFSPFVGDGHLISARLQWELGNPAEAARHLSEGAAALRQIAAPMWTVMARGAEAVAALITGDSTRDAWGYVAELTERSDARKADVQGIVFVAHLVLQTAWSAGMLDAGLSFCAWLLPYLEEEMIARVVPEVRLWRGRIHASLGRWAEAVEDFQAAEAAFDRLDALAYAWQPAAEASRALSVMGEAEQSASAFQRARDKLMRLADRIGDLSLRDEFAARPDVAKILAGFPHPPTVSPVGTSSPL